MTIAELEAAARALTALIGDSCATVFDAPIERIEEIARLDGGSRHTFKYDANAAATDPIRHRPFAIECATISIGGVFVSLQRDRALEPGESRESDWRSQPERDQEREAKRLADEAARKATVVSAPRPVVCSDSRWAYLEVD